MKRLLFIAHRVPFPPDKGDRLRAFHEIQALSGHFDVTLAALAHDPRDIEVAGPMSQWCSEVILAPVRRMAALLGGSMSLLGGKSVTEGYFSRPSLRRKLLARARQAPFDLVLAYCSGVLPCALRIAAAAHVVDLVDVDSAKWASYAQVARWPVSRLYRRESRTVAALERKAIDCCEAALVVSDAERSLLGVDGDKVMVIGNGVDARYFQAAEPNQGKPSVVFTGTMDYLPNVQATCWFVREIWPALKRAVPDLTFTVVGRDPTVAVKALAGTPGVVVTGSVPDVRPYLAASDVAIAPLHIARGVQNKVLEAMAMSRAVVASPAALEGLEIVPGSEAIQAQTPAQWVAALKNLLEYRDLRDRLGQAARKRIEISYSWPQRMAPLVGLCQRLAQTAGAHSAAQACRGARGDSPAVSVDAGGAND